MGCTRLMLCPIQKKHTDQLGTHKKLWHALPILPIHRALSKANRGGAISHKTQKQSEPPLEHSRNHCLKAERLQPVNKRKRLHSPLVYM